MNPFHMVLSFEKSKQDHHLFNNNLIGNIKNGTTVDDIITMVWEAIDYDKWLSYRLHLNRQAIKERKFPLVGCLLSPYPQMSIQ